MSKPNLLQVIAVELWSLLLHFVQTQEVLTILKSNKVIWFQGNSLGEWLSSSFVNFFEFEVIRLISGDIFQMYSVDNEIWLFHIFVMLEYILYKLLRNSWNSLYFQVFTVWQSLSCDSNCVVVKFLRKNVIEVFCWFLWPKSHFWCYFNDTWQF
jgi:hypothetical protein